MFCTGYYRHFEAASRELRLAVTVVKDVWKGPGSNRCDYYKPTCGRYGVTSLDVLRDEYPGNDAWASFVSSTFQRRDVSVLAPELITVDADIASVVTALLGDCSSDWWSTPVKALGGAAPSDVFHEVPSGAQIVRSLLMRFP